MTCILRFFALLTPAILIAPLAAGDRLPDPDAGRAYTATKSAPVNYDIDCRVIVTAPAGTKTLKVWVPLPPDDAGQRVTAGEW